MAAKALAFPSFDLGPVDFPPWSLHRPFIPAGAWQGVPLRVRASHFSPFKGYQRARLFAERISKRAT